MIDRAAAVAAAQEALARRAAIVFVHLVGARGVEAGDIGLRAIYESGDGLSVAVATPGIDRALARLAGETLASGHLRGR